MEKIWRGDPSQNRDNQVNKNLGSEMDETARNLVRKTEIAIETNAVERVEIARQIQEISSIIESDTYINGTDEVRQKEMDLFIQGNPDFVGGEQMLKKIVEVLREKKDTQH